MKEKIEKLIEYMDDVTHLLDTAYIAIERDKEGIQTLTERDRQIVGWNTEIQKLGRGFYLSILKSLQSGDLSIATEEEIERIEIFPSVVNPTLRIVTRKDSSGIVPTLEAYIGRVEKYRPAVAVISPDSSGREVLYMVLVITE